MKATVKGYEGCSEITRNLKLTRGKVRYALLPVWVLHTKWNDKDYLFAMNGQTGKLVGDLPCDKKRFWITFAGLYVVFAILATLAALFL